MADVKRVTKKSGRYYQITDDNGHVFKYPSITTILGQTSDKSGLVEWKKRIGEKEANRISSLAANRGTVMHRLIELYKPLVGTKEERLEELKKISRTDDEICEIETQYIIEGWKMFMKFWRNHELFFDRVKKVLEAETFLWSTIGYAGTVDNVSEMIDDGILVIDYKNSRRPKREEWIQDYYLQAAAYYVAYYQRSRKIPKGAEIWIANEEDDVPQIFTLTKSDLKYYFDEFRKRLKKYNEMKNNG